jgi:hypothetical protein
MDFGQAIGAMKRGEQVARAHWRQSHIYLDDGFSDPVICRFGGGPTQSGWSPTASDMLATDWIVCQRSQ